MQVTATTRSDEIMEDGTATGGKTGGRMFCVPSDLIGQALETAVAQLI